ncbi:MAG: Na+/H+ antiporter subunit E [Bacteroidales bacterium]|nr:Na+/H+ antiporter subunit E [Bacteroidales bacterium]
MRYLALFILSFVFWMLLTFDLSVANLVAGGAAALVTSLLFTKYFFHKVVKFIQPVRYFWFLVYLVIFTWECIKANFDVAYRVLHPAMPIKPGIVKVKLELKSDFARAMLANSITMTPGTISVDIIDDVLYVHWIYVSSEDPEIYSRKIAGKFEKYIKKIFE